MKKTILIFLFVGLLVITGCKKGEEISGVPESTSGDMFSTGLFEEDNESSLFASLTDFPIEYFPQGAARTVESAAYESDEPLIITDFGPHGELPAEVEYPSIWVLFSQPVIPLSMRGKPEGTSQILKIDPPLKGVFRWYGTKLLSFDASEKGLPQHIYNIDISDQLQSLGGKQLVGKSDFSFHTEYLSLVSAVPGRGGIFRLNEVPVSEASRITVTFNHPVNLEIISEYLQVISTGKNYVFEISRPVDPEGQMTKEELSRIAVLEVKGSLKENSTVQIKMLKGARSEAHFIGAPAEEEKKFKTVSPFIFKKSSARSYSFPGSSQGDSNPVFFEFSHPVVDKK
jgi:hypothetical protein